MIAAALVTSPAAFAHPATTPAPPGAEPPSRSLIPPEDEPRYRSEVTAVAPAIPGLEARIIGGQDKLELTWSGSEDLVVEGTEGEPMLRFRPTGIEVNERSPSAYASSERFGRVDPPSGADPDAPPSWRPLASPGPFSWYEHRAQWMRSERPASVTDEASAVTIRDWSVPITVGGRDAAIEGTLSWTADPAAIRAQASELSSPLLSALVLVAAMVVGGLVGVRLRPRLQGTGAAG